MKSLKIKSLKNSLVSIILCILLSFSCILFSSCTVDIEEELAGKTYFSQYIDSFKVVYANSLEGDESNIDNLVDDLVRKSFEILLYYYAYGDSSVDNANVFPDDIRMFVYSNKEIRAEIEDYYPKSDLNYRWKWTLNDNLDRNNIDDLKPNSEETYGQWKDRILGDFGIVKIAYDTFLDIYLYPLQTVLYEIMLGYELTTFDIDYQKSDGSTVVTIKNCPSDTSLNGQEASYSGNARFKGYIERLLSKYQRVTKYVGFTQENSDRMINYILDNVIGTDLVNYDYLTYGPSTQNTTHVLKNIEKDASAFKTILGMEDDIAFNAYVSGLKEGDLIYKASGYNYLIYKGTSGTGTNKRYYFEEYYNYRNYVQRVASIVYGNTYDGSSKTYEYSRDMYQGTTKIGTVSYDYVKANGGEPKIGESALIRQVYSAQAATFLRNYEGETFFEKLSEKKNEEVYAYGDSPKAEYQSILLVPTDNKQFILEVGFGFNIVGYNPNLKLNIKARYYYYNEETKKGILFEFDAGQTSFTGIQPVFDTVENLNSYQTEFETGFDLDVLPDAVKLGKKKEQFVISPFSDADAKNSLSASGEINLGESANQEASNYYKVINSQNGYGGLTVFDESKVKCSFYEIVFDVVKNPDDPENADYDFKISLSLLF